jgi:hypothetical protein
MIQPSRIAKFRFPFFDEGRYAFLGIRRPVSECRKLHFRLETFAERNIRGVRASDCAT